jgi:sulfane dehydrogenase subunit SoxC
MDANDLRQEPAYGIARADEYAWLRARELGVSRRQFLGLVAAGGGTAAAALALAARPALAEGAPGPAGPSPQLAPPAAPSYSFKATPPGFFTERNGRLEMRWEAMYGRGFLVPNDLFFYVSHAGTPPEVVDLARWRLKIEGSGVSRPTEFTYDEIVSMPSVSIVRALECAGNGRAFFGTVNGKAAPGPQFQLGMIGVAEWTGVPLRELLDRAGLKRTARDVKPEGFDPARLARPIPVAKALEEDTIVAWAMNGEVLPRDHGFPVRLRVPGWVGSANVKWIDKIEVSEQSIFTKWNTELYVLAGTEYPAKAPAKGIPLTLQNVKSAFELPWDGELAAGRRLLRGRSWSANGKIKKVEVSTDGGGSWRLARLRDPNPSQAWVRWDVDWDAPRGNHKLQARATDERGYTQPAHVPNNDLGYQYDGVVNHAVKAT